jgi:hypothetical protein
MEYTGPGTYEFTFAVVMDGDSMEDALAQARDFLSDGFNQPSSITLLEEAV